MAIKFEDTSSSNPRRRRADDDLPAWLRNFRNTLRQPAPNTSQANTFGLHPAQQRRMSDPVHFMQHEVIAESMPGGALYLPWQYPSLASLQRQQAQQAQQPAYRGYGYSRSSGGGGRRAQPQQPAFVQRGVRPTLDYLPRWLQAMVNWQI